MILIGQYDSPFVRRVAIAMAFYGMPFDHRPWSTFRDAELIAAYNPLKRVPTLVLDDGEVVIESALILDALDHMAGWQAALAPQLGAARRAMMKVCALGSGLGDKAVALVYERALHDQISQAWIDRCRGQISAVLDALEADRAQRTTEWWFGPTLTHADIMVACAVGFVHEAHGEVFDMAKWPALMAHSAQCEALKEFQQHQQAFIPPA
jgi:glutathione S-transferase